MAKKDYTNWDRKELIKEIDQLRKRKKYGLVWEDKPEDVVEQCKKELPVLEEVKSKEEQARQTMRHWREDAWNKIQTAQKEKKLTEDDKFHGKDELQKLIDDFGKKIKDLIDRKSKEVS